MKSRMRLTYKTPAPMMDDFSPRATYGSSWERYSLPLGNGFFGANIFGRLDVERIQISDPTLANPYYVPKTVPRYYSCASGVNSMAELLLHFGHEGAVDYERTLSLDDAVHTVSYRLGGVGYKRTTFLSHPDRVLVMLIEADRAGSVSFEIENRIPFLGEYNVEPGDGMGKRGDIFVSEREIATRGEMEYYGILYESRLKVLPVGGLLKRKDGTLSVSGADSALIIYTSATNYELSERVFSESEPRRKLEGNPPPTALVEQIIDSAQALGYDALLLRHLQDYRSLYGRVSLSIGESEPDIPTDELLDRYKRGERSPYLELLLYQYGRYLMISSSRTLLPTHLQGIWNAFSDSPWSCGYWHNINLQMNYWSVGSANLSETFEPYVSYARAYMPQARRSADELIREHYPDRLSQDGENGWIIGTGAWPYKISTFGAGGHSGPGTGAFTALLFWDHYDYTQDVSFLRDFAYPALRSMSTLYHKLLVERDGEYLIEDSASPENVHNGEYYHTVGCAFDQQMVYECFKRTVDSAELLGVVDGFIDEIRALMPKLSPVLIGNDGQIKEYREETGYSSIGEPQHRHVSHLVGLYPGTIINESHPEWIRAAEVTLNLRGDRSHCWATAHRMLLWARTGNGKRAMDLLKSMITNNVMENLWDWHPPFQIDGNFGYTAGVAEMLVGGSDGVVRLLPALPDEWRDGEFHGIVARGGIELDCRWREGRVVYLSAVSRADCRMELRLPDGSRELLVENPVSLTAGEHRVLVDFEQGS